METITGKIILRNDQRRRKKGSWSNETLGSSSLFRQEKLGIENVCHVTGSVLESYLRVTFTAGGCSREDEEGER